MGGTTPRMRKIITRVIVFLLLGAIVNVAVAWGGFVVPIGDFKSRHSSLTKEAVAEVWQRHAGEGWPAAPMNVHWREGLLARHVHLTSMSRITNPQNVNPDHPRVREIFTGQGSFDVTEILSGFPVRFLARETWSGQPQSTMFGTSAGDSAIRVAAISMPRWFNWPGFAINALFYGGILWLLFAAPFALRRRIRIKRGLCPACAYPIGASDICTECGRPVPSP